MADSVMLAIVAAATGLCLLAVRGLDEWSRR